MSILLILTIFNTFGNIIFALEEQRSTKGICPIGWQVYNIHCYKHVPLARTWEDAHQFCRDHYGADLASVTSQEENDFIYSLIHSSKQTSWLGLRHSKRHIRNNNNNNNNNNKLGNNNINTINNSRNVYRSWIWTDGTSYSRFQNWKLAALPSINSDNSNPIDLCGEV
ncbi:unnamed protein product, partial [Meganyctiphanes norvegica]